MYQEMFASGLYDSAQGYDILRTLAEAEFEEECAEEEARKEYEEESN
ncbi:hypothetical protein [Lachnospira multipara]|uniref:Uncharacterized protein n=1 Tax=Lachnospira multipara TaxID=28051 RepID=A0A1H5VSA2_9FIRM|nr:hypothetical protein [Lachnospira multipara]SEF89721.1 hypothetical protein SAMN05216537_11243 [Lachnospira multipara]